MKRLFLLLFVFALSFSSFAGDTELPFAIGEWTPYTGEKLPEHGAFTEIVTAACKAAGLRPRYLFYPWKRAEFNVLQGKEFATFPYSISKAREPDFHFSDPVVESVVSVVSHAGNPRTHSFKYEKIDDLLGYRIGFTAGDPQAIVFKEKGINFLETQTIDQSVEMLAAGRIDLIVEDRPVTYDAIRRLYPAEANMFVFHKTSYAKGLHYRLMVSKGYPNSMELLARFNDGLKKIKDNGTLKRLYKKHGLE